MNTCSVTYSFLTYTLARQSHIGSCDNKWFVLHKFSFHTAQYPCIQIALSQKAHTVDSKCYPCRKTTHNKNIPVEGDEVLSSQERQWG